MTLVPKQKVFTLNTGKLIVYAYQNGFELTYGEAYRPLEMQKIYFETGRSKTLTGRHPDRLAVDFNIFYHGRMLFAHGISKEQYKIDLAICRLLGEYWESLDESNVWGGDFNRNNILDEKFLDPYHFESRRD